MSVYRRADLGWAHRRMPWRVVVSPSVFRAPLVLGEFRWRWHAVLAAWWHVTFNPHALACVQERR